MKDIDALLKEKTPHPNRPLKTNFTQAVLIDIKSGTQPGRLLTFKQAFREKLTKRIAIIGFGIVLFIGGTAAAVAFWPTPEVTHTSTQQLPSGDRIVGVHAKDCQYGGALDGRPAQPSSEKIYYEVRDGSRLTDTEIISAVQGICEGNVSNNAISTIIKQLPQNLPGMLSTEAFTVNAISPSGITISPDPHYKQGTLTTRPNLTFTHFAENILVYDRHAKASYSDIQAGDTVRLIVEDFSGIPGDTPETANALNRPDTIKVLAVLKIPALTADPLGFYTAVAKDIVRAEPCDQSPTGFCRAYDFAQ